MLLPCLHVWRAALASRLRVAHLPLAAANRSRAFRCRAHASRTHAPLALVACACARAPRGGQPPAALAPAPARQRASPAYGGALRAALTPPPRFAWLAGPPAAALRVRCGCARRGGAASAARHWRPVSRLRGGVFAPPAPPPPPAAGKKELLISLCFT